MANSERLPTVLYRTPAATATTTPLSSGYTPLSQTQTRHSSYHQQNQYGSPASPIFSPLSNATNGKYTGGGGQYASRASPGMDSLVSTHTSHKHATPVGSYLGLGERVGGDAARDANVPRQLYGNGHTAPPPVMSLREGASLRPAIERMHGPGSATKSGSGEGNYASSAGPNPLLANEYAFGPSSASGPASTSAASGAGGSRDPSSSRGRSGIPTAHVVVPECVPQPVNSWWSNLNEYIFGI